MGGSFGVGCFCRLLDGLHQNALIPQKLRLYFYLLLVSSIVPVDGLHDLIILKLQAFFNHRRRRRWGLLVHWLSRFVTILFINHLTSRFRPWRTSGYVDFKRYLLVGHQVNVSLVCRWIGVWIKDHGPLLILLFLDLWGLWALRVHLLQFFQHFNFN